MKHLKITLIITVLVAGACAAFAAWSLFRPSAGAQQAQPASLPAATFVGRDSCAQCHEAETAQWRGSHHDLAMQAPTPDTVLGDFSDASFTYHEVTSTFFRRGDGFFVRTDGPDGSLHEYKIAYTFGVYPLQQYLIEFPGGRYQALNVCWDSRPADQGGQRWFHLYPNENVTSDDILHWTGPYQNWNHMCAECHSTDVHKGYDAAHDTFNTTWSELNVSCEACHGPGSEHVAWANRAQSAPGKPDRAASTLGLVARLRERDPGIWIPDPVTGIAKRDRPRTSHAEIEMCARCHSRRATFDENVLPGRPLADTHRLALLEPALYQADGQILDEVYEYGSFIQSRMFAAGVTCTDCHDPHTLQTAQGNLACARCHLPEKFDTPAHHFHTPGEQGSACVQCHMPTRNYMVVHARHDHSMRVPRPDLTISLGVPNACNGCHTDRSPQWAADEIARHTNGKPLRPHFGEALAAGRRGLPDADAILSQLLSDHSQPAIARATAADMLVGVEDQSSLTAALQDPSPIVRAAAVNSVSGPTLESVVALLRPLLTDPVRQVRMDAARRLATVPDAQFTTPQRESRDRALDEYIAAQHLDADRAEARINLGALYAEQGDADAAEREYRAAIRLNPHFAASYINLGDLYRQLGREADALTVLREGVNMAPDNADAPHALGLALVRANRLSEALPLLKRATTLAPDSTRYAYVYAIALETTGPPGSGIETLKRAHERRPNDMDVIEALIAYCHRAGRLDEAVNYAASLLALRPLDPQAQATLQQLKAEQAATPRSR